ncbi:hypothetical protein ASG69_18265 [Rhodococcus sp. Leaf225]|nr:hypothetical protein ASG69_18265 [Rhodococcus sp. Leaf225]KQU48779.1 hypothetical protein ASH03_02740 [Rhodococcus sp. Leaf258]
MRRADPESVFGVSVIVNLSRSRRVAGRDAAVPIYPAPGGGKRHTLGGLDRPGRGYLPFDRMVSTSDRGAAAFTER